MTERNRANPRAIGWLSFATMFIVGTDTFLVAPLLPELRERFGVSTQLSGWLVSAYALGYALCALGAGPLSDRTDRRRMLLAGMTSFAILTAVCGLAWGFWPMAVLRFLAGAAAALATPQIWASIPQLVPREGVVWVMGRATAGLAVAQLAGIPLGAFLAASSWRLSFFAVGAVAAGVTVILALRFPAVPQVNAHFSKSTGLSGRSSRSLVVGLLAYFVFQTGNFAALSFFGSWFSRDFGLSTMGIGVAMIAIGAGNAAGSLFGHRLVAKWGISRSLRVGIEAMLAGYVLIAVTGRLVPAVVVLAAVMLAGGFVFPAMMTTLQSWAGAARGTVASLSNVAMYGGSTVGAAVAGLLFEATPEFSGVAVFAAATFLMSLMMFSRMREAN